MRWLRQRTAEQAGGEAWRDMQHTRAEWAALRQRGVLRYLLTAQSTWLVFVLVGLANPIMFAVSGGGERFWSTAAALSVAAAVGGVLISWQFWRECERTWHADAVPPPVAFSMTNSDLPSTPG